MSHGDKGRRPQNRAPSLLLFRYPSCTPGSTVAYYASTWYFGADYCFTPSFPTSVSSLLPRTSSPRGARALGAIVSHGDKRRRPQNRAPLFFSLQVSLIYSRLLRRVGFNRLTPMVLSNRAPVSSFVSSSVRLSIESFLNPASQSAPTTALTMISTIGPRIASALISGAHCDSPAIFKILKTVVLFSCVAQYCTPVSCLYLPL